MSLVYPKYDSGGFQLLRVRFCLFSAIARTLLFCLRALAFFVYLRFLFLFTFRCPVGQKRSGPDGNDCVYDADCFGVNKCLNGGTCVKDPPFYGLSSVCLCPPFFEGPRCELATDATYVLSGGKDFVIIIIFALAILLSKFWFFCFWGKFQLRFHLLESL